MKRLLTIIGLCLFATGAFAVGPHANPSAFNYAQARLFGAQAGIVYWSGCDTISPPGAMDTTGHDSIMDTGFLQINWMPGDQGTYPNYSLSDSMTAYAPNTFDLWVRLDTTEYCSNVTANLNGYGKWAEQTGNTKCDSLGFYKIYVEYQMLSTDSVGIMADSMQIVAFDGYHSSSPFYGIWQYEDRHIAIAGKANAFKYRLYHLHIPPCLRFRVFIEADKALCEIVRVPWYVVAAHS